MKSRWARFEVRPVNKEQVNQHNNQKLHQVALSRHWQVALVEVACPTSGRPRVSLDFGKGRPPMSLWIKTITGVYNSLSPAKFAKDQMAQVLEKILNKYSLMNLWEKMTFLIHTLMRMLWHQDIMQSRDIAMGGDGKGGIESLLFGAVNWQSLKVQEGCLSLFDVGKEDWKARKSKQSFKLAQSLEAALKSFSSSSRQPCAWATSSRSSWRPGRFSREARSRALHPGVDRHAFGSAVDLVRDREDGLRARDAPFGEALPIRHRGPRGGGDECWWRRPARWRGARPQRRCGLRVSRAHQNHGA